MSLRSLLDRIRAATSPASTPPTDSSVLDRYVRVGPSPQVAVDLFAGTWSSALPLDGVTSGPVPLFADARVAWALELLGPVAGRSVLELGPLEAGHTYQLTKAGASVVAIEAQTTAYLKCLVVKELLGITGARFLLGDFLEHMRATPDRYDVCFASGVLYHLRSPVEALALAARVSSRLVLWTHYYDEGVMTGSDLLRPRFTAHEAAEHAGYPHTLHRFEYASGLELKGFCGGSAAHANWLSREDLLGALAHLGWEVDGLAFDDRDHPHGPALALVATHGGGRPG